MRSVVRSATLAAILGVALATGLGFSAQREASPVFAAHATRVLIYDNDGRFQPGDPDTGMWGFHPAHVEVRMGELIQFDNPAGNFLPHTVTSITWGGSSFARTLESGARFNSSPDMTSVLTPGGSWTLDTGTLDPGQYLYYCTLHPWMVGTITVMPQ